jgi:predicted RNA binding protein YcfA (HicA-like mRNA interferase family)
MNRLLALTAKELIRALEKAGFQVIRQRGSHVRLRHSDGRVVTVPVHAGQIIGRGFLKKILRDARMSVEDLLKLIG